MKHLLKYKLLIILGLIACKRENTEDEVNAFVAQQIELKIEYLTQEKRKDCYNTILKIAEQNIDSIILQQFEVDLLDSIEMVEKPFRPLRPQYIRDIDTSTIKPIF